MAGWQKIKGQCRLCGKYASLRIRYLKSRLEWQLRCEKCHSDWSCMGGSDDKEKLVEAARL